MLARINFSGFGALRILRIAMVSILRSIAGMIQKPAPQTIKDLIEVADRPTFEKEVGVKTQLVTRALSEDVMPPRWYIAVRNYCVSRGFAVPDHLFKWHDAKQPADANPTEQDRGAA